MFICQSCSEPSCRLCSKLVVRRLLRLLPSNDLETPGFFGSDYKDYENLSNLFSLKPQSGDGRGTCCQEEHLSGVTLPWSGAFLCRGMDGKMSQKKFGKSLQSLQSNAESLGNIRALDGYESDYRQAITIAYSHQLTIQLALDETAGQSPPGKERGFQSLVTESPKDIALEILNSLSYCHHPHHRIRHHLPDQALLDHHLVHCHHIPVRQSMFLIHLLDHLKTCLQKIAHPHQ